MESRAQALGPVPSRSGFQNEHCNTKHAIIPAKGPERVQALQSYDHVNLHNNLLREELLSLPFYRLENRGTERRKGLKVTQPTYGGAGLGRQATWLQGCAWNPGTVTPSSLSLEQAPCTGLPCCLGSTQVSGWDREDPTRGRW